MLRYADEHGVPAVAMCVSTTYGGRDWNMTPQGGMVAGAAFGKVPFVMDGIRLEAVGVDDAAGALILAAEHGRNGERYIVSEKMISNADLVRLAAEVGGVGVPRRTFSVPMLYGMAAMGSVKARLRGTPERLTLRLGSADASGVRGGPQQGSERAGVAAAAGRGGRPRRGPVLGGDAGSEAESQGCAARVVDVYAARMPSTGCRPRPSLKPPAHGQRPRPSAHTSCSAGNAAP